MKFLNLLSVNIIFLLFAQTSVSAQTNTADRKIQSFHFLIGDWTLENFKFNEDKVWESLGKTDAKNVLIHDGKFIKENVKYLTAYGDINMITFIGYDSRINSYKLCAMDKEFGVMDIYHGEINDNGMVFSNLKSDSPFIMDNGKSLWFRITYKDITENSFTHLVEGTIDKGKTWFYFSKSVFVRLKD